MVKNEILNVVDTTLYLGLGLDAKLQWNSHITSLAKKLSSAAYAGRDWAFPNQFGAARRAGRPINNYYYKVEVRPPARGQLPGKMGQINSALEFGENER
ncbi:hypothetical protein EVAR_11665_1 [Eumeta japonica]|uniref:Uncharacterized protein n=1 Tax=Eumeta variegata TaxID=151549 RepID=A0A4C1U4U7_EUMVA|nr:hypothetical protein EVAR_11665_1 [Eumeta japonica]